MPHLARLIDLSGGSRQALSQRFRAWATAAPTHVHPYLLDVLGRSGLALEIIDDQDSVGLYPVADYLPGTNTGATTTGFTGYPSTLDFTYLDNLSGTPAEGGYNTAAMNTSASLKLKYRGSATALGAGIRVVKVELWAMLWVPAYGAFATGTSARVPVIGLLDIAGTEYPVGGIQVPRDGSPTSGWAFRKIADIPLNPATGLPWTITAWNRFTDATNDEFGIQVGPGANVAASGFWCAGLSLRPFTSAENRYGSYYLPATPVKGVSRQTLANTRSLKVGEWYRWLVAPLSGQAGTGIRYPALRDPQARIAQTPIETFEQRQLYEVVLTNVGGVPESSSARPGEIAAGLLEDVSGIASQSSPFAALVPRGVANIVGSLDTDGTAGSYATMPNATRFRVSTAAAWAMLVSADDWTPAADSCLWSMSGANTNEGWELWLLTTGVLRLRLSEDGSAQTNFDSTVATGLVDGTGKGILVTFTANSATGVKFYLSNDLVTWTQLGANVSSSGFTDIHPSTAQVEWGAHNSGTDLFNGRFYFTGLWADVAMTDLRIYAPFDTDYYYSAGGILTARPGQTTLDLQVGGTLTLQGTASFKVRNLGTELTAASGTNAYGAIEFPVGWSAGAPNAPLIVEIFSLGVGYQGAGTPLARGVLTADAYAAQGGTGAPRDVSVQLRDMTTGLTWTPTASTKYLVLFRSSCSSARQWLFQLVDTLSTDPYTTKTTTTAANIEGASQGPANVGATDRAVVHANPLERYDLPVRFLLAPAPPSAPAAGYLGGYVRVLESV